jgi:hypothetical protein
MSKYIVLVDGQVTKTFDKTQEGYFRAICTAEYWSEKEHMVDIIEEE